MKKKGFTLIELVMVILLLGILSAVALPRFFDLQDEAREAAEQGVVGGVRAGIAMYYADQCAQGSCSWPANLSGGAAAIDVCDNDNPCFTEVLQMGGITDGEWEKTALNEYQGPVEDNKYVYDPTTGEFSLDD